MSKPSGGVMKGTVEQMVLHRRAMPVCAMLAAAGAALLATQILAWRLDRATAPVLPKIPSPPAATGGSGPVNLSSAGFVPRPATPSAPAPSPNAEPAKSGLSVDLIGTFVGRHSAKSVALLQLTTGARDVKAMRIGEKWQGMELLAVERSRVWVRNLSTGAKEYVANDQLMAATFDMTLPARPPRPPVSASSEDGSSGRKVLSRAQVNRLIQNNTNLIFSWVNVQPHAVAGQVVGFKLNNIKPRGKPFFDLLGFYEGDIIKRVNGVKMDSVDRAVGLWENLHGKEQVSFTVDRGGVEKEITIEFKP